MSATTESVRLVAVTACPTGIAHSQMAAESLETTATELGHDITVEVRGAMGTQNELTVADIDDADAVIVAADTAVPRDRFDSLPVIKGTVKDGVSDATGLIERAVEAAGESSTPSGTERIEPGEEDDSDQLGRGGDPSNEDDRTPGVFERLRRLFT